MIDLKFYKADGGVCQTCGRQFPELISAKLFYNNSNSEKRYTVCRDCAVNIKKQVLQKNAAESRLKEQEYQKPTPAYTPQPQSSPYAQKQYPYEQPLQNQGYPYQNTPSQPDDPYNFSAPTDSAPSKASSKESKKDLAFNAGGVFALLAAIYNLALFVYIVIMQTFYVWDFDYFILNTLLPFISIIAFFAIAILGLKKNQSNIAGLLFAITGGTGIVNNLHTFISQVIYYNSYYIYYFKSELFSSIIYIIADLILIVTGAVILLHSPSTDGKAPKPALYLIPGIAYIVIIPFSAFLSAFSDNRYLPSAIISIVYALFVGLSMIFYTKWYLNPYKTTYYSPNNTAYDNGYNQQPESYYNYGAPQNNMSISQNDDYNF